MYFIPTRQDGVENRDKVYSSSIMRARRLQEVNCRFEIRRTLRAAKDERHLLSSLMTVDHSLFLRPHHSITAQTAGFMGNFFRFITRK